MPLRVGTPIEASPPDSGRSIPILIVSPLTVAPLLLLPVLPDAAAVGVVSVAPVLPVPPLVAGVAVEVSPPHAVSSMLKITSRAMTRNPNFEDFMVKLSSM